jgi:hypothetical protein
MRIDRQAQNSDNPPRDFSPHAPRSRAAAFFDWVLGTRLPDVELNWEQAQEPEIVVVSPIQRNSWVDSFHTALTEAATSFILQHVDPYHREDPTAGFAVRRVKVGFHQAADACLRAIQTMPPAMRDRIVLLRIKKANGSEQLMLDQFYGLSILAEETLVDGQLVETMVSYSGSRFQLRFEFEGEYVTLPSSVQTVEKPGTVVSPEGRPDVTPQVGHSVVSQIGASANRSTDSRDTGQRDTPLYAPSVMRGATRDTPLYQPAKSLRSPVARLLLMAMGEQTTVELYEDGFPYTIGRHPESPGFAVRARNCATGANKQGLLAHTQNADTVCYVSREHLRLNAPDLTSGEILVDNVSEQQGKNGTYVNGERKPHRFIHILKGRQPLCLGGADGEGILRLAVEPA